MSMVSLTGSLPFCDIVFRDGKFDALTFRGLWKEGGVIYQTVDVVGMGVVLFWTWRICWGIHDFQGRAGGIRDGLLGLERGISDVDIGQRLSPHIGERGHFERWDVIDRQYSSSFERLIIWLLHDFNLGFCATRTGTFAGYTYICQGCVMVCKNWDGISCNMFSRCQWTCKSSSCLSF